MGAQQVKCSCGKNSCVEIDADYEPKKGFFGLDGMSELSGYKGWSYRMGRYLSYHCESCAEKIGNKMDQYDDCEYEMRRSEKGYWRTDLP